MPTDLAALPLQVHLGDPARIASWLAQPGAIRTGHFRLLSGMHTDAFVAFSAVAAAPAAVDQAASWLAPVLAPWNAGLVLAPSTAGVALAGSLARYLSVPLALASLGTTGRAHGVLGDIDFASQDVLIVNDVLTTGQGLKALSSLVAAGGGRVAGAAWFLTRTPELPKTFPMPSQAVLTLPLPAWNQAGCALCHEGQPAENALDLN
jgi:orotate phosphoribosyltransferase